MSQFCRKRCLSKSHSYISLSRQAHQELLILLAFCLSSLSLAFAESLIAPKPFTKDLPGFVLIALHHL